VDGGGRRTRGRCGREDRLVPAGRGAVQRQHDRGRAPNRWPGPGRRRSGDRDRGGARVPGCDHLRDRGEVRGAPGANTVTG